MPGWSGCDVCELPHFQVQLTIYVPRDLDPGAAASPLPPGNYHLVPALPRGAEADEHIDTTRTFRVVVQPIDSGPPLEQARRDCMSAGRSGSQPITNAES